MDKDFWKNYAGGLDEAKKVYQAALNPLSEDFPWSEALLTEDQDKINEAKNLDDIKEKQAEVSWDQFFRINGITGGEIVAWKTTSGLLTVKNAKIAWGNGWKKLTGSTVKNRKDGTSTLGNKAMEYKNHGFFVGVNLTIHYQEDVDNALKLCAKINASNDLAALHKQEIKTVYQQDRVPGHLQWAKIEKRLNDKKIELFKTAFEGANPISITNLENWLSETTGLARNGTEERKAFDNGWTEPNEISSGETNFTYKYANNQQETVKVKVLEIAKPDLETAFDLREKIENETDLANLEKFVVNKQADLDGLAGKILPKKWRKEDIEELIDNQRNILGSTQFINDFYQALGQWKRPLPSDKLEIVNYKKNIGSISPVQARQIYEHYWEPTEITWKNNQYNVASYDSHQQAADVNLNALEISKEDLNIVNKIIKDINEAKIISDLPQVIDNYDKGKVPNGKKHLDIETLWNNKRDQLKAAQEDQKAIRRIKDYWSLLGMNGDIKEVCGDNWENNLEGKPSPVIATEENRLKNLIKEAKVQPDIIAIEAELQKKPVISASELQNSDYKAEMLNLVADDTQRTTRKQAIISKISQIREDKLEVIREIIANAQNILNKDQATKEELATAINDLKTLTNAPTDSAEQIVWEAKKDENEKLLTDLEEKLKKLDQPSEIPHKDEKPIDHQPTKDEYVPMPTLDQPLTPQQEQVWGEDFLKLKPKQQEKRKKVVEEWNKENKENKRESTCLACQKTFAWDTSLAYLPARKKAQEELKEHQKTCSLQAKPEEVKKVLQDKWIEENKKSNIHNAYSCQKCWGKIYWNKNIAEAVEAKQQAIADLMYHEKHECGGNDLTKSKIAIYFSPNEGGNEHAPLSYAEGVDENELMLEKIYSEEVSQEREESVANKPTDWTPWIIGGSIFLVGGLILAGLMISKKKRIKKEKK